MARSSISYLGPAFLVCVGCMDPGKWATALEGGSRFGLELVWVLIAACIFSAFLQSLSSRLGLATGRNLAQICGDEYPRYLSVLLWFQCEVSVLILDLTMVLGIAMALNALLGLSMSYCVAITAADTMLFLMVLPYLGLYKAELFTASIMGVVLLCFSVEALHNNVAITPVFQGLLPRLKGEMLYIAAGILGANIIPSNFYLHSALIQEEKHSESHESHILLHHSIVDIATGSGVTLLVNLAVLSSAASAFHSSGHVVITLQDAQALMEQVLSNSVAPAALGFALICAGQLSTLSGTVAGQVAVEGFLGLKLPLPFHRIFTRLGATLAALFLVWSLGCEGAYQVLIFSQVILALQLPLAIVPLLKATSSQAVMGSSKNSLLVETISWICTGLIYVMNFWVAFDMFFGESDEYMGSGSWNLIRVLVDSSTRWRDVIHFLCLTIVVGLTTLSTLLLLWMISAPFKAEGMNSPRSRSVSSPVECISGHSEGSHTEATKEKKLTLAVYDPLNDSIFAEEVDAKYHEAMQDRKPRPSYVLTSEPLLPDVKISDTKSLELEQGENFDADAPQQQVSEKEPHVVKEEPTMCSPAPESKNSFTEGFLSNQEQQSQNQTTVSVDDFSFVNSMSSENSSSRDGFLSWTVSPLESTTETSDLPAAKTSVDGESEPLKRADEEVDLELLDKDDYDIDGWENLEQDDTLQDSSSALGGSVNSLTFEEPESGKSFSARSDASEGSCGGSGSGSLSRLSGLGRSARRQFAALLDEFWAKLYDLHGQSVSHTHGKSRGVASAKVSQVDTVGHHPVSAYKETFGPNSTWFTSKLAQKSWQKNVKGDMAGPMDAYLHASYHGSTSDSSFGGSDPYFKKHSLHDLNEKRYSSLRFPTFRDGFDNQPATIHGYKMPSYAGRSGSLSTGVEATSSYLLERQCQLLHPSSDEQASSAGSFYRLPTSGSSELEKSMVTNSVQSFLSAQYAKQSPGRPYENSSPTSKPFSSQTDRPDPYGRSNWTSYTGRDAATWDPLVYRVTGELDIPHHDQIALQRVKDPLNYSLAQQPIGERGYFGTSPNNKDHFKSQIERAPLSFDEISPSQSHKDAFSIQSSSQNQSLWATQPFEQLFGSAHSPTGSDRAATRSATNKALSRNGSLSLSARDLQTTMAGNDHDIEVLNSLRLCIRKLLKLDGSDWLFRLESGSDEDLIGTVATREKVLLDADTRELHKLCTTSEQVWTSSSERPLAKINSDLAALTLGISGVPHCGEGCVWSMELVISFGMWCIHRVLELALMESRPELWGKYTYVLNRLQGVLDPAFSKPRTVLTSCICVISEASDGQGRCLSRQGSLKDAGMVDLLSKNSSSSFPGNSYQGYPQSWPWGRNSSTCKGKGASSVIFLEIIKDVETAIGSRKGRTGTAAGDVAFPKGKENLASVLKRYKRRLGNRSPGTPANGSSSISGNRRVPALNPSAFV